MSVAKMHRTGRAWYFLGQAFKTGRVKRRVANPKAWQRRSVLNREVYERLIQMTRDFGIRVRVNEEFEPVTDYFGRSWVPAGSWSGFREGIRMDHEGDTQLLVHEWAHGVDEMLGPTPHGAPAETVASAAAFLFCVDVLGWGDLANAYYYPTQKWGATPELFDQLADYIVGDVFRNMLALYEMQAN